MSAIKRLRDELSEVEPEARWHSYREALAAVEELHRAAEAWWASKRPVTWTDAEHAANPFVNCVGPREQALAAAVRRVNGENK